MSIRPLRTEDLDALLRLYAQLNPVDDPLPGRAEVEATWAEALVQPRCRYVGGFASPPGQGGAVGEGPLASTCTVMVIPNLTRGCRPYALIENVVTDAAHRQPGWGQAVLAQALAFAWSQRCYKAMLLTGRKDEATMRFYENAGFDRHGKQGFIARPPLS